MQSIKKGERMNRINDFKKLFNNTRKKNCKYDCLVLFSGGKDSTYLAHLMQTELNAKVCLFNINNGYEDTTYAEQIAAKLGMPMYIYSPPRNELRMFYHFILSNRDLTEIDTNPLCFLCNRYFTQLGLEFASNIGIPMVINALTFTQIFGSDITPSKNLIGLSKSVIQKKLKEIFEFISQSTEYKKNVSFQKLIHDLLLQEYTVETIYPFMYYDYNITKIKEELIKEYGWYNPIAGVDNDRYITSGCKLTTLFGLCEEKLGYKIHELDEIEFELKNMSINRETFDFGRSLVDKNLSKEMTKDKMDIISEIGVESIFCEE